VGWGQEGELRMWSHLLLLLLLLNLLLHVHPGHGLDGLLITLLDGGHLGWVGLHS